MDGRTDQSERRKRAKEGGREREGRGGEKGVSAVVRCDGCGGRTDGRMACGGMQLVEFRVNTPEGHFQIATSGVMVYYVFEK